MASPFVSRKFCLFVKIKQLFVAGYSLVRYILKLFPSVSVNSGEYLPPLR